MKRIISGILGVVMAASMAIGLAGCGGKDGNTLVWYMPGDKPADHDMVMAAVNEKVEAALGKKLDLVYIDSSSYGEKMKLKMASGEDFDLMYTGWRNPYQTAVEMGGLMDITDLVEQVKMNEVVEQYFLDSAKINGKIYAVPNMQVISNPNDMNVPPSVLRDCGIEDKFAKLQTMASASMSFDELKAMLDLFGEMFAAVKKKRPDLYAWNPSGGNIGTYTNYEVLNNLCLRRDGTDPTLYIEYETEEWKLGCQKVREWYKAGYIRNDIASVGNSLTEEDRKKVAFVNNTWSYGVENSEMKKYGEPLSHALLFETYVVRTAALLTMIGVGANAKDPETAVKFIRLINEDVELYNLLIWGIEGTHYTKNEDGSIVINREAGYMSGATPLGYNGWQFGNQFNAYLEEGEDLNKWVEIKKQNDEAVKSPMLGFVPDTTAIATEIANTSSVIAEYKAKIYFGTEDFDVWYPEFCQKMESAGIKKVQSELQAQYDAFLASK